MNLRKALVLAANIPTFPFGQLLVLGHGSSWKRTRMSPVSPVLMCASWRPKNRFWIWPKGEGWIFLLRHCT